MGKIVDTSILIAVERGEIDLTTLLAEHGKEEIAISAVTASELLHGVHRVKSIRSARMEAFIESMFEVLPVIPFDLTAARAHARLSAEMASSGNRIGERDLMIAATALASDREVVTRDLRSFPRVPNLRVVHW